MYWNILPTSLNLFPSIIMYWIPVPPGLSSMGGDLQLFREHIIRKDKEGLLTCAMS